MACLQCLLVAYLMVLFASMVYSLAVIPFELVGGVAADVVSPTGALAVFGVVLLGGSAVLWLWERPVRVGAATKENT